MKNRITFTSSGLGILDTLGIIFIVLKLIGAITWSWWGVLSPFLIQIGILILALVIFGIVRLAKNAKTS